jgi:hypothetical protein
VLQVLNAVTHRPHYRRPSATGAERGNPQATLQASECSTATYSNASTSDQIRLKTKLHGAAGHRLCSQSSVSFVLWNPTVHYPHQSSPNHPKPMSTTSISILFIHQRLGLPSGLFPRGFPTNIICKYCSRIHATCPVLILLDLIILIILDEEYKSRSSSLCSFLHPPVTYSHPYRTTGKTMAFHILIYMILDSGREDGRFGAKWWQMLSEFNQNSISF